jgi:GNAT superfamily N-acetyltransferase
MMTLNPPLPLGYSPVGPARLANVVTCLEMTSRPPQRSVRGFPPPYELVRLRQVDIASYRALFRKIGQDWMWFSRLIMPDDELRGILGDPQVELFVVRAGSEDVGMLELDFRAAGQCELAFFGLVADAIGKGLGRALMEAAIERAWARPIGRLWVHTCTFDHPSAVGFYIRSGFRPYAYQVEVQADPRLTGHLPRTAAPHIPLIEGGGT